MHLTYTCFAGRAILEQLSIETQAYRTLTCKDTQREGIALICHDSSLDEENNPTIHCSYHILNYFHPCNQIEVMPAKVPFSLKTEKGYLIPDVEIAD